MITNSKQSMFFSRAITNKEKNTQRSVAAVKKFMSVGKGKKCVSRKCVGYF